MTCSRLCKNVVSFRAIIFGLLVFTCAIARIIWRMKSSKLPSPGAYKKIWRKVFRSQAKTFLSLKQTRIVNNSHISISSILKLSILMMLINAFTQTAARNDQVCKHFTNTHVICWNVHVVHQTVFGIPPQRRCCLSSKRKALSDRPAIESTLW